MAPRTHQSEADGARETPLSFDGLKPGAVATAEAAAESFHTALRKGDRDAVLALLAPEVTISEGGRTQSRDEYASGHLGEDIAFMRKARLKPVFRGSMSSGETAMVGSETLITLPLHGKRSTSRGRELLTLKRLGVEWKIVRIRWQSLPAQIS